MEILFGMVGRMKGFLTNLPTNVADPARTSALWDQEYETRQVIPSSTRVSPSKALVLMSALIGLDRAAHALDAGCGNGRNAVYLAERGWTVKALDTSQAALRETEKLALERGVDGRVETVRTSLTSPLPFPPGLFDLVLDSYVFCHFLDDHLRAHYRSQAHRALRKGGTFLSFVFSREDEYYHQFVSKGSPELAVDPNNGITKRLYEEEEITRFFSGWFAQLYLVKFEFDDVVLGHPYRRSVLVSTLTK